jgi:hypothetical protein
MGRIEFELTLLAAGWGAGVLLIAAAATVAGRGWQRAASATLGAAMLLGIGAYALLPLR